MRCSVLAWAMGAWALFAALPAAAQDCNVNGVADDQDLVLGTSLDCQGDGVPDECQLFPLTFGSQAVGLGTPPAALAATGGALPWVAVAYLTDAEVQLFAVVDGVLTPGAAVAVGDRPESVLAGRLREALVIGGGGPDLVTANADDGTVSVLTDGLGGYADVTGSPFPVGGAPTGLAAVDLTLDGHLDFVVTNRTLDELRVIIADGSGGWVVGTSFATGGNPRAVVGGDFDGDGDGDVLVGARTPGQVELLENNAGVSFLPAAVAYTVGDPIALAVGDVDGDADLDVAVLSTAEQAVHVLENDGSGGFSLLTAVPVGAQPFDVRLSDLDGNGTPDLVVAVAADDGVTLALNQGDGSFAAPVTLPVGDGTVAALAADLDVDGRMDLVTTEVLAETVSYLPGLGGDPDCDGNAVPDACELAGGDCDASGVLDLCELASGRGFGAPIASPSSGFPAPLAAGDFDEDGHDDLFGADGDGVRFFRGEPAGTLAETAHFATGDTASDVLLAHLDGDGHLDLAVANRNDDTLSVLRGDGTGSISASELLGVTASPRALAAADLDRDGDTDLAVRGAPGAAVSFLDQDGGLFGFAATVTLDDDGRGLLAGDATGDGHPDLLAVLALGGGGSAIQVVENAGGGTLNPLPPILATTADERILSFGAADLDGVGAIDLVLLVFDLNTDVFRLRVALGDAGGSYAVSQQLPLSFSSPTGAVLFVSSIEARMALFDADLDGDTDLVLPGPSSALVFANDGAGSLSLSESFPAGPVAALAPADVDGDGAPDLVGPATGGVLLTLPGLAFPAEATCFGACLSAPAETCVPLEKAKLTISEKKAGKEKWKLALRSPTGAVPAPFFGDPVAGTTRVDVCLYDALGALLAELAVDRAGDLCGPKAKPCWKAKGATGFAYKDPAAFSSGVRKLGAKSKNATDAKLSLAAANNAAKGQNALPVGAAGRLQDALSARVQVLTTDGACFDATLADVKKADGETFKAKD